jgi:hypothetical protein
MKTKNKQTSQTNIIHRKRNKQKFNHKNIRDKKTRIWQTNKKYESIYIYFFSIFI